MNSQDFRFKLLDILESTDYILMKRGWIQNKWCSPDGICLTQAIILAIYMNIGNPKNNHIVGINSVETNYYGRKAKDYINVIFRKLDPDRNYRGLVDFNDSQVTSFSDVKQLLIDMEDYIRVDKSYGELIAQLG